MLSHLQPHNHFNELSSESLPSFHSYNQHLSGSILSSWWIESSEVFWVGWFFVLFLNKENTVILESSYKIAHL